MEEDQFSLADIQRDASNISSNMTEPVSSHDRSAFELRIAYLIAITFGITIIVGIIGNSLVFLTIMFQKQMRSTTNILILNLAIAELLFIFICVPTTGLNYVLSVWYFGDIFCRISQYTSNVTAYVIILLLVFMSFDRYLAINIIGGTSLRNQTNATYAVNILWIFVFVVNIPHLLLWKEHSYQVGSENRTVCILQYNIILSSDTAEQHEVDRANLSVQVYYTIFFLFGYVLPFISIFVIYGLIMLKLKKTKGQQVSKGKRRVSFMVIAVVSSFVLCWGPLQIMLFLQHVIKVDLDETGIIILVISNCIAYLNACINPIIYGFANQDFRK